LTKRNSPSSICACLVVSQVASLSLLLLLSLNNTVETGKQNNSPNAAAKTQKETKQKRTLLHTGFEEKNKIKNVKILVRYCRGTLRSLRAGVSHCLCACSVVGLLSILSFTSCPQTSLVKRVTCLVKAEWADLLFSDISAERKTPR